MPAFALVNMNESGRPYSDATAQKMDDEARTIIDQAYQRTLELCTEKAAQVSSQAL